MEFKNRILEGFLQETKNVDGVDQYVFILSTGRIDRHAEIVEVSGIDTSKFEKNAVMFYNHDSYSLPVGKWLNIWKDNGVLYGTAYFHEETEESKTIKKLVDKGILKAVSIGFISKAREVKAASDLEPDVVAELLEENKNANILVHTKSELLEASIVTIPANSDAVRVKAIQAFEADQLNEKEFDFVNSMIEKAGAVLNSKNKNKLSEARNLIDDVLETASKEEEQQDELNEKSCNCSTDCSSCEEEVVEVAVEEEVAETAEEKKLDFDDEEIIIFTPDFQFDEKDFEENENAVAENKESTEIDTIKILNFLKSKLN